MKNTTNYNLNLPESTDFFDVEHFNQNAEAIDEALKVIADAHKQISGTIPLSTSLLEKSLTLGEGVHIFKLLGTNYTGNDLPNTAYTYGEAMVLVRSTSSITVVLFGAYSTAGSKLAVNHYNGSGWYGWGVTATVADLENYFPNTGGMITGEFTVRRLDNGYSSLNKNHSTTEDYGTVLQDISAEGKSSYIEISSKYNRLRYKDINGTVTTMLHSGNIANHALSIGGGTVNGESDTLVTIKNMKSAGTMEFIKFDTSNLGELGKIGFSGKDNPMVLLSSGAKALHHDGNSAQVKVVAEASAPEVGSTADTSLYPEGCIIAVV